MFWAASTLGCGDAKVVVQEAPDGAEAKAPKPKPKPKPEPKPQPEPQPTSRPLPATPPTFEAAALQASEIHGDHRKTFFCGCVYTPEERTARGTCGYETRADDTAAKRIAWDHVVPIRAFGSHRSCWQGATCRDEQAPFGGVRCCREKDPQFRAMEADLYNIVPVIAELQQDRSNYPYGEVDGEPRMYGACDIEIDRQAGLIEPKDDTRGDVARAHIYLFETYGAEALPLSMQEIQQFRTWHEADPPDEWERRRAARVQEVQGNAHPLLAGAGQSSQGGN